jgi:hypothetical protein
MPVVDSMVRPVNSNRAWRITWTTKSYANITEYRLLYRKIPVGTAKNND